MPNDTEGAGVNKITPDRAEDDLLNEEHCDIDEVPDAIMDETTHDEFDVTQMDIKEDDTKDIISHKNLINKIYTLFNNKIYSKVVGEDGKYSYQAKVKCTAKNKAKGGKRGSNPSSPYHTRKQ